MFVNLQRLEQHLSLFSNQKITQICLFIAKNQPVEFKNIFRKNEKKETKKLLQFLIQQGIVIYETKSILNVEKVFYSIDYLVVEIKTIIPFFLYETLSNKGEDIYNETLSHFLYGFFNKKNDSNNSFYLKQKSGDVVSVDYRKILEHLINQKIVFLIEQKKVSCFVEQALELNKKEIKEIVSLDIKPNDLREEEISFFIFNPAFSSFTLNYSEALLFLLKEILKDFLEKRYGIEARRIFLVILENEMSDEEISTNCLLPLETTQKTLQKIFKDSFIQIKHISSVSVVNKETTIKWFVDLQKTFHSLLDFLSVSCYNIVEAEKKTGSNLINYSRVIEDENTFVCCIIQYAFEKWKENPVLLKKGEDVS